MKKLLKFGALVVVLALIAAGGYGAKGYYDATSASDLLRDRADKLIANDRGGDALGAQKLGQLLLVQDPTFRSHSGVDHSAPGAGVTTITQSVSKRLAFEKFTPGLGKIRQTGYALGLEGTLSKDQILALWLDTLEMGNGPEGWMTGFHTASEAIYSQPPASLTDEQYFRLLAVLIAPGKYNLLSNDDDLSDRVKRIAKRIAGDCSPIDNSDVWLDGCK